tara:strand:- start:47 stop:406 length:360 start_codon:yes stop_codon:yes gene_type:complete
LLFSQSVLSSFHQGQIQPKNYERFKKRSMQKEQVNELLRLIAIIEVPGGNKPNPEDLEQKKELQREVVMFLDQLGYSDAVDETHRKRLGMIHETDDCQLENWPDEIAPKHYVRWIMAQY